MQTLQILSAWLQTKNAMGWSPSRLDHHRDQLWRDLQPALRRTPALRRHAGKPLDAFPITSATELRENYGAWNSLGLEHEALKALADEAEAGLHPHKDLAVGWSTGSQGGARGLFLTTPRERAIYIGQSLARLLPVGALFQRQRIALHLRAGNALYSDAGRGRFTFQHLPLSVPHAETMAELQAFEPTILIAPPYRLLDFAKAGLTLPSLRDLFYGSEPLSEAERDEITSAMGLAPRAIYQATEGFIAAECAFGRLHLNDHALTIELDPIPGTPGFRPILTDLYRTSQPIVRLMSDDYLEIDPQTCPCGFAGRTIHPIEGRLSDIWTIGGQRYTPPHVVKIVEAWLGGRYRWQAIGHPQGVTLRADPECPPPLAEKAAKTLAERVKVPTHLQPDLPPWSGPKRRKVVWHSG